MDQKDYYKIMGVDPKATDKEIKMAYRRLARKYHPDISKEPNATAHFQEVGEAYEVLKDPEKRQIYDQYRQEGYRPRHAHASGYGGAHTYAGPGESMDYDFFESLFGAGAHPFRQQEERAHDAHGTIQISLEEAFHGAVKELQLPGMSHTHSGNQTLRVKIPAGVKSGQKIRLAGQGYSSRSGSKRGDLYITVQISKHPLFDVMGNDIYVTLPVTPWEVALGSTIAVPTLAGKVDLKIPPGSQGGQTLRLKHRGFPGETPGDQYVILKMVTPKPHTESAKALYQKMAEEMPINPRETMGVK